MKNITVEHTVSKALGNETHYSCEDLTVELSAYFDGELEGDSLKEVEAHLTNCEECQQRLEKMKKISRAVSSLVDKRLENKSFVEEIMAKVEEEEAMGKKIPS